MITFRRNMSHRRGCAGVSAVPAYVRGCARVSAVPAYVRGCARVSAVSAYVRRCARVSTVSAYVALLTVALVTFGSALLSSQAKTAQNPVPKVYPPVGNMAQLMRGIFFPNSNLIFTVQTHDPAVKPTPPPAQPGGTQPTGFSWMDWGAGIYGGWEMVDNAAVALADASPLMLAPGIRCENGRAAPVTDPDWIKFTEQMIDVARRTYKASQSRSQDAVSELTGDLSDACAACHQAYRDVRGRGQVFDPNDPSNKANRCMSRVAR
jgi:hypothetical protein